jgi:hypothetical protein
MLAVVCVETVRMGGHTFLLDGSALCGFEGICLVDMCEAQPKYEKALKHKATKALSKQAVNWLCQNQ